MSRLRLFIFGAGGHGQVIADAALSAGWFVASFIDQAVADGRLVGGRPVIPAWPAPAKGDHIIIAVGDNAVRARLLDEAVARHWPLASIVHASAWVSPAAVLGQGVFIGPHAVVNAAARLGDGVIVNSGAIVEHHCVLGRCVHLAPAAALAGAVTIGDLSLIGIGASVRPRIAIGARCTVGVGAAVVTDVPADTTVVGVPARAVVRAQP